MKKLSNGLNLNLRISVQEGPQTIDPVNVNETTLNVLYLIYAEAFIEKEPDPEHISTN